MKSREENSVIPKNWEEGMEEWNTFSFDDEAEFWQGVSQVSLQEVWDDPADDIYAELL
jgi:hypothetical protein